MLIVLDYKSEYTEELYFEIPKECEKKANAENQIKKVYPIVLVLYRKNTLDITANDIVSIYPF